MNESLNKFKEELINSGVLKRTATRRDQFRGKYCPRCGDEKYHCYVKINVTTDEPVLWHCFKCNEGGIVGKEFLKAYGLDNVTLPKNVKYQKAIEIHETVSTKLNAVSCNELDNVDDVINYIYGRIGVYVNLTDLQMFRYVGNPISYVKEFFDDGDLKQLKNRHWFQLTNGNIIGRFNNDDTEYRWLRFYTKRIRGRGIYTMRCGVDTHDVINIVIAEGIMDVIGLYYHYPLENAIYIATLGSDYKAGIQHVLKMGLFGDSVMIHIFKDSDVNNDMIKIPDGMMKLYKHIYVYQNMAGKDYGVHKDGLDIHRVKKLR